MGIRFYCPKCDRRLHVKDFLAGKRGICPHCDEGIVIPPKSTIAADDPGVGESLESQPADDGSQIVAAAPRAEAKAAKRDRKAKAKDDPAENDQMVEVSVVEEATERPSETSPVATNLDAQVASDPIVDSPHLIWYVRPPAGGQYGPAEGDVMRQWLSEGRVTNDSLVWQEGWEEWRPAAEVFPQLVPPDAAPPQEEPKRTRSKPAPAPKEREAYEEVQVDSSKVKMLEYRLNRSRGKGKEIVAVAVLGIVCVVLVVLLGFVITQRF